jgi:uncharacterized protein YuzE
VSSGKLSYDPETDAAYMHLTGQPLMPGGDSIPCDPRHGMRAFVVMGWKDGKVAGLELLGASSLLHADLLAEAQRPGSHHTGPSPSET